MRTSWDDGWLATAARCASAICRASSPNLPTAPAISTSHLPCLSNALKAFSAAWPSQGMPAPVNVAARASRSAANDRQAASNASSDEPWSDDSSRAAACSTGMNDGDGCVPVGNPPGTGSDGVVMGAGGA